MDTTTTTSDRAQGAALATALAYHRAWTNGDMDAALAYVADDVICDAPVGRLEGVDALRDYMSPFAQMAQQVDLLAAEGDNDRAIVVYDTVTPLVASAPGAELLTVRDGRIIQLRLIFDRLPFAQARGEA
jgi:ketosteroid isomerase-like protein